MSLVSSDNKIITIDVPVIGIGRGAFGGAQPENTIYQNADFGRLSPPVASGELNYSIQPFKQPVLSEVHEGIKIVTPSESLPIQKNETITATVVTAPVSEKNNGVMIALAVGLIAAKVFLF